MMYLMNDVTWRRFRRILNSVSERHESMSASANIIPSAKYNDHPHNSSGTLEWL